MCICNAASLFPQRGTLLTSSHSLGSLLTPARCTSSLLALTFSLTFLRHIAEILFFTRQRIIKCHFPRSFFKHANLNRISFTSRVSLLLRRAVHVNPTWRMCRRGLPVTSPPRCEGSQTPAPGVLRLPGSPPPTSCKLLPLHPSDPGLRSALPFVPLSADQSGHSRVVSSLLGGTG